MVSLLWGGFVEKLVDVVGRRFVLADGNCGSAGQPSFKRSPLCFQPACPTHMPALLSPCYSALTRCCLPYYFTYPPAGTLRLDPTAPFQGKFRREYASLNNKCMELRKVGGRCHGVIIVLCCVVLHSFSGGV